MKKLSKAAKYEVLKSIVLFLTGMLLSQWLPAIKDLSFTSNILTAVVVFMSFKIGFSRSYN